MPSDRIVEVVLEAEAVVGHEDEVGPLAVAVPGLRPFGHGFPVNVYEGEVGFFF